MGIVAKHVGGPVLVPGGADPFKFGRPGSLSAELRKAGFANVEEETKSLPWTWPGTAEEVWEQAQAVATPFLPLLQRVPAERRDEIDARSDYRQFSNTRTATALSLAPW